ncbi:MAG: hypothetical protein PWR20_896 [Bacteroidales bacterium]|jgi:hypothetical protein|nr:hypothetical protein [Bacteroidales bacterium]MDN5329869.1 hypothetical protein [Bacteroidales bacterium]
MSIRLFKRKLVRVFTFWGWLVMIGLVILVFYTLLVKIGGWLSYQDPLPDAEVLVVEGFLPDYALQLAAVEFEKGNYKYVVTTGIPFTNGIRFCAYSNFADQARAVLIQFGIPEEKVFSAPTHEAYRDRTYASAVALRKWFLDNGKLPASFNMYSMGAHAARSSYLYKQAFRDTGVKIGVLNAPDLTLDKEHWWKNSKGFRTVPVEALGYLFVRLFFKPY